MVKPDPKYNYYADLDLTPNCSIDDIKKQYRKLALLYHPDRNAGKEDEYVPRFQAIQTAHEVLGDVATKQKYDADRRRGGGGNASQFRSSQPTPGNPYTATSAYPPPPRRTQPGTWQRPKSTASNTPSGADRFSNFGRGAPTARKDPAQDRANIFRAWQNMPAGGQTNNSNPNRARPPPPPRPDTSRATKEESRPSSTYFNTSPDYEPDSADQRQSDWQAFQKSNASRPNARRADTNNTPKKGGFDPSAPGSDERPAGGKGYMPRSRADNLTPDAAGTQRYPPPPPRPERPPHSPLSPSTPLREQPGPFADPLKAFKARTTSDDIPFAEANRSRTPYSNISGERTTFSSDGLRRSVSTRDTTKLAPSDRSPNSRARSSSPVRNRPDPPPPNKPFVNYDSSESSVVGSDSDEPTPRVNHTDRPKKIPKRPSIRLNRSSTTHGRPSADNDNGIPSSRTPDMQQKSGTNIFSIPIFPDTFSQNGGKSRSEEHINTKFSQDDWNGPFQGSQDSFESPRTTQRKAQSPGGKYRPRSSHRSSTNSQSSKPSAFFTSAEETGQFTAEPAEEIPQFRPAAWEKTFREGSWAWDPSRRPSSPTKSTSARNKMPARKAVPAASPDVPPSATNPPADLNSGGGINLEQDDAMDIDPAPPSASPMQPNTSSKAANQEPRLYSVPPSAWRQQQPGPTNAAQTLSSQPQQPNTVPLRTNLDDLRHVEPIVHGGDGLLNLGDISATLPFQSRASSAVPNQSSVAQKLQIPELPKPPPRPTKLSAHSWTEYAGTFGAYIQAYHVFESLLLQHFAAREQQFQKLMSSGTGWVGAVGDTVSTDSTPSGFASYLKSVREDAQAREAWTLGAERHVEALEAFEQVRERVKYLVSTGSLAK